MAYNNMFPTNYQPYYPQTMASMPQNSPQQNTGITWVQGEAGAKSYLVAPNTTVTLWDSEAQVIYLKSADVSGMPSMKIIDYTIRDDGHYKALNGRESEFATKVDVESVKKDILALNERIDLLTRKGDEDDE